MVLPATSEMQNWTKNAPSHCARLHCILGELTHFDLDQPTGVLPLPMGATNQLVQLPEAGPVIDRKPANLRVRQLRGYGPHARIDVGLTRELTANVVEMIGCRVHIATVAGRRSEKQSR